MAAIAPIVVPDGQATPVNHTFSPVSINGDIAMYTDRASGISVGMPVLTTSLTRPTKGARNYRAKVKMTYPVLEVTAPTTSSGFQPAPTKAFELTFISECILPERSNAAQRKDIYAMFLATFGSAVCKAMIVDLESTY